MRIFTLALLGLYIMITGAYAAAAQVVSAFYDDHSQQYTVVCSNQRTLDGVTYEHLIGTAVCETPVSQQKPTTGHIKTIVWDYPKKQMTVNCITGEVFHLTALKGFRLCEPEYQYKSFMDTTDSYYDGYFYGYASDMPLCLLNKMNHVVCKTGLQYFTNFTDAQDNLYFTIEEMLKLKKSKAGIESYVGLKTPLAPVDENDPFQQLVQQANTIVSPTGANETFENLRYNDLKTVCGVESQSKILYCWDFKQEVRPATLSWQALLEAKGIRRYDSITTKIEQYYTSATPVQRYRFRKLNPGDESPTLLITFADGTTHGYKSARDDQGDISFLETYPPYAESFDSSVTQEEEQITGAVKHGFKNVKEIFAPYLSDKHLLISTPKYNTWDYTETGFFGKMYEDYLKALPVLDFTEGGGRFCYIVERTGQVACADVSSDVG